MTVVYITMVSIIWCVLHILHNRIIVPILQSGVPSFAFSLLPSTRDQAMESPTMLDPQKKTVLKCSTFPRIFNEQRSGHFLLPYFYSLRSYWTVEEESVLWKVKEGSTTKWRVGIIYNVDMAKGISQAGTASTAFLSTHMRSLQFPSMLSLRRSTPLPQFLMLVNLYWCISVWEKEDQPNIFYTVWKFIHDAILVQEMMLPFKWHKVPWDLKLIYTNLTYRVLLPCVKSE